jgi:tetratricopeptide (TPR) repeat protein
MHMLGRLKFTLALAALALALPTLALAQDGGRFRVLIPYFEPQNGADRNFGRQASEDLREMMGSMPTHVAMDEDDIEDQAERFNMDIDDLNCLYALQLAAQIDVPILVCGSYTQDAQRNSTLTASIRTVDTSDEFVLPPITVGRDGREEAARHVMTAFERYNTLIRSAAICTDYAASQQWEAALRNCEESLAINPNAMTTRYMRAQILYELERLPEALEDFDRVLEMDPLNENALRTAGFIATRMGDDERGRAYYRRYLDVNPGNTAIRMSIASQMAEAGDPQGALEFIQPGLDVAPDDADLLDLFGTFAFMGALDAQTTYLAANASAQGLSPEAADFYRQGIDAYLKVIAVRGAETPIDRLRNLVIAYSQLEDYPAALAMAERVFEREPNDVSVRNMYADVLKSSGRLEDALAALDRVLELEPDHPSARVKKATWLIEVQRIEDAVATLLPTAVDGPSADNAATMIFNEVYTNGFNRQDYAYTIRGMVAAKTIPNLTARMREQLHFWHGLSIFQRTSPLAQANNLESARVTLPAFQEAQALLNQAGSYPSSVGVDMAATMQALATYIEIQEALIRRGY